MHMLLITLPGGRQFYSHVTFPSFRHAAAARDGLRNDGIAALVIYGPAVVAGTDVALREQQRQRELQTVPEDAPLFGAQAAAQPCGAHVFVAEEYNLVVDAKFGQESGRKAMFGVPGDKRPLSGGQRAKWKGRALAAFGVKEDAASGVHQTKVQVRFEGDNPTPRVPDLHSVFDD